MRILGIDYGRRRLGLAVSDEEGVLASPVSTYRRRSERQDLAYLVTLVAERGIGTIVVGLPLNMDGSLGGMAEEVAVFAERLKSLTNVPVVWFDERLTTQEAERVLVEADLSRKRRRPLRDALAATLILQGFLDRRQMRQRERSGDERSGS
jgi:putative Holliday junction resolvase